MSKFSDYLTKAKLDPRRVLSASKHVEQLRPEDRKVRLAKAQAKLPDAPDAVKAAAAAKRRSGRPVGAPTIAAALRGDKLSQGQRQRLVRAVNAVLTTKKQTPITFRELF